jgi:hypothetical protein
MNLVDVGFDKIVMNRVQSITKLTLLLCIAGSVLVSCSFDKLYQAKQRSKIHAYEQINFQNLMKRYMAKEGAVEDDVEGIYSVSLVVTKRSKGFLSNVEKEKVTLRNENYQQVAIIRDTFNPNREYLEIELDPRYSVSYSVRGEFNRLSDSNILIYNHFDSRKDNTTYTFTYDQDRDMLEGVRKVNKGQAEYTYKLTYMKMHPKEAEISRR